MPDINISDEQFDEFWYKIPGVEFFNESETEHLKPLLNDAIEHSLNEHERLDKTDLFQEFLDEFGIDAHDFPWEDFRDWVESMYEQ